MKPETWGKVDAEGVQNWPGKEGMKEKKGLTVIWRFEATNFCQFVVFSKLSFSIIPLFNKDLAIINILYDV